MKGVKNECEKRKEKIQYANGRDGEETGVWGRVFLDSVVDCRLVTKFYGV